MCLAETIRLFIRVCNVGLTNVVSLGRKISITKDQITRHDWNALPWRRDVINVGANNSCNFRIMINFFNLYTYY